jgi:hypothetical protein
MAARNVVPPPPPPLTASMIGDIVGWLFMGLMIAGFLMELIK